MTPLLSVAATLDQTILVWFGIFVRVAALVFFLPGVGERAVSVRIRLGAALAFSAIIGPVVLDGSQSVGSAPAVMAGAYGAELLVGTLLGLSIRLLVYAIQTAGTIAAQSISVAQMFGGMTSSEPEPIFATILSIGAITAALAAGLHVQVAIMLTQSYDVFPYGSALDAADLGEWSAARGAAVFNIATGLALPFVIVAFIYNVALGAINRAMPQMMVAFVGAPAITAAGIGLLALSTPLMLEVWLGHLDLVLANPHAANP